MTQDERISDYQIKRMKLVEQLDEKQREEIALIKTEERIENMKKVYSKLLQEMQEEAPSEFGASELLEIETEYKESIAKAEKSIESRRDELKCDKNNLENHIEKIDKEYKTEINN